MEKQKNNGGLVVLVIILFLLLLGLGGYIIYDKLYNSKGSNTATTDVEINQNGTSNLYDNIELDKETLDKLYYIIGALPEEGEETTASRHCLNAAITNSTYLGNLQAHDVFSWYVKAYNKAADYDKYKDAIYSIDGITTSAYHCAACLTIEKTEVEKFKQLYYFVPEEKLEFIKDTVQNYDNIYGAVHSLGSPVHCDYNVKHNITGVNIQKGTEGESIYLTDEQIVTRYDDVDSNDISQLTKQTINYGFYKKNGTDTYQLDHVFHRNKVK